MKTVTAREAKNTFGKFLDMAQREPVMVTKHERPVGVFFSIDDVEGLLHMGDQIKAEINLGIQAGIADADNDRVHECTDEYIQSLQVKLQKRLSAK